MPAITNFTRHLEQQGLRYGSQAYADAYRRGWHIRPRRRSVDQDDTDWQDIANEELKRECTTVTPALKVPGLGWKTCGFSKEPPTRRELIEKLTPYYPRRPLDPTRQPNGPRAHEAHCLLIEVLRSFGTHPFTCSLLVRLFVERSEEKWGFLVNLYTGACVKAGYDFGAHVRGYLYEMSPSSKQYWFKYGAAVNRDCPPSGLLPINCGLACFNADSSWSDQAADRPRGRTPWRMVDIPPNAWRRADYGPLPTPEHRCDLGRKKGVRGWRVQELRLPWLLAEQH